MLVRMYFDGSRSSRFAEKQLVTHSGICADEHSWAGFETMWREMLKDFDILEHGLHMTDLMSGKPPFNNWSKEKVERLLGRAANALGQMVPNLRSCVSTVNLTDHRRLKAENPKLASPYSIVLDAVFSGCAHVGKYTPADGKVLSLYFDRTEPYLKRMNHVWLRNRKKYSDGWLSQIYQIIPVSSRELYAVQGADLLAWPEQRYHATGESWNLRNMIGIAAMAKFKYFDYERLSKVVRFFEADNPYHPDSRHRKDDVTKRCLLHTALHI